MALAELRRSCASATASGPGEARRGPSRPPGVNVLMVTSSYPKFPGDVTAPFIEEIARGVVARGHQVDVVLPHHPRAAARPDDEPVRFFPYRYAPLRRLERVGLRAEPGGRRAACGGAPTCWRRWWRSPCGGAVAARLLARALRRGARALGGAERGAGGRRRARARRAAGGEPARQRRVRGRARSARARRWPRRALRGAGAVTACSGDLHRRALAPGRAARAHAHRALRRRRRRRSRRGRRRAATLRARLGVPDGRAAGAGARPPGGEEGLRLPGGGGGARLGGVHVVIAGEGDLRGAARAQARAARRAGAPGRARSTARPMAARAAPRRTWSWCRRWSTAAGQRGRPAQRAAGGDGRGTAGRGEPRGRHPRRGDGRRERPAGARAGRRARWRRRCARLAARARDARRAWARGAPPRGRAR